jgi:flagellar basal body-associated protein FliL
MTTVAQFPSFDQLLALPLYGSHPLEDGNIGALAEFWRQPATVRLFCIKCAETSVFQKTGNNKPKIPGSGHAEHLPPLPRFEVVIYCLHCKQTYSYFFRHSKSEIMKIGQFPSMQDIGGEELSQYRKYATVQDYSEITRATGLASHNIGIASFVYLRRVFERMIARYEEMARTEGQMPNQSQPIRMDDRIEKVGQFLPKFLVENRKAYSILSVGIHELDESQCLKYFPVLRDAIILMLQKEYEAAQAKAAEEQLKKSISDISSMLGSKRPQGA